MKMNKKNIFIALPKGRILNEAIPLLKKINIIPEASFFDLKNRKLQFSTNLPNVKLIVVRSFDVATFLIYGAAQIAIIGSDVFNPAIICSLNKFICSDFSE